MQCSPPLPVARRVVTAIDPRTMPRSCRHYEPRVRGLVVPAVETGYRTGANPGAAPVTASAPTCDNERRNATRMMNSNGHRCLGAAAALLAGMTLAAAAIAAPIDDASGAFARGDYATAIKLMRPLADQGNSTAQYYLALMHHTGEGVEQSNAEAAKWYRKAADNGDARAQFNLALMYKNGQGIAQSHAEAVKWYRKAADQGNAMAQNSLGLMYDNGDGLPKNQAEAAKWYRKAADQGSAKAQFNLAVMYANGQGVRRDAVEAYKWYTIAASRFPAGQTDYRGMAVRGYYDVAEKMTPAQIAQAKKLAAEWKPK
jgi:TPR repeat protein